MHGGVYGVIFDAAMNFAVNSALESGDRGSTLDVSYQIVRAPEAGTALAVRADVVRAARSVAFVESRITDAAGDVIARACRNLGGAPQGLSWPAARLAAELADFS